MKQPESLALLNGVPPDGATRPSPKIDLDLAEIARVLRRRKWMFWQTVAGCLLLALIYLATEKRRFRAEAELQVLTADSAANITGAIQDDAGSALQLNLTMQTYVGLLTSDALALSVIHQLNLEQTAEYHTKASGATDTEASQQLEQTRFRREQVLRRFHKNLQVSIVSGSRLITLSFLSTDPELARRVLNRLIEDFIQYNYEIRFKSSTTTEDWLSKQLVDLKAQVQSSQEEAGRLQRQTGVFGLDGSHNIVIGRLESLNQELIAAQQNRIVKEAILHVVKAGDPEAISNLSGTAGQATSPASVNSLALIQTLRQQEAVLSSQYADLSSKYGINYPRLSEVRDQLKSVEASIEREHDRLTARAQNDYNAAVEQESQLKSQMDQQKSKADRANDLSIRYLIANREATSSRDLYEHLLQKLKEVGIFSGLHSTNIDVIDPPHVGASAARPAILQTLAISLGIGTLLGLCLIFLVDSMDNSIYTVEAIREIAGAPLLGTLPAVRTGSASLVTIAFACADAPFTEALRQVRTSLLSKIPHPTAGVVILVTSAAESEGKTIVSAGLAGVLMQAGHRVLLVDSDLRHGTLSQDLAGPHSRGLSDILTEHIPWEQGQSLVRTSDGLSWLPAGLARSYPAELLSSAAIASLLQTLQAHYDYIILDSAAVVAVTDSVALSSLVDSVVLVVRYGVTAKPAFEQAVEMLREVHAPIIGCIFNHVQQHPHVYPPMTSGRTSEETR